MTGGIQKNLSHFFICLFSSLVSFASHYYCYRKDGDCCRGTSYRLKTAEIQLDELRLNAQCAHRLQSILMPIFRATGQRQWVAAPGESLRGRLADAGVGASDYDPARHAGKHNSKNGDWKKDRPQSPLAPARSMLRFSSIRVIVTLYSITTRTIVDEDVSECHV